MRGRSESPRRAPSTAHRISRCASSALCERSAALASARCRLQLPDRAKVSRGMVSTSAKASPPVEDGAFVVHFGAFLLTEKRPFYH